MESNDKESNLKVVTLPFENGSITLRTLIFLRLFESNIARTATESPGSIGAGKQDLQAPDQINCIVKEIMLQKPKQFLFFALIFLKQFSSLMNLPFFRLKSYSTLQ